MRSAALAAALISVASLQLIAAQRPPAGPRPDPLVREGATQKVSDHVYVIPDNSVPLVPNVGIIVGNTGVLVIDTGMGNRNGATVLREAQKVAGGKPIAYLATTHVHPEHDLGANAFPATTRLIRAQAQIDEIASDGMTTADLFRSMSALNADLLKDASFRKADITFTDEYRLDLGGVRVRFMAMGFNHTKGDTVFFVEPDAVLFSGDVVMTRIPNVRGPEARVKQWLSSLDKLEALKPKVIVPSHGPTGDVSMIAPYRAYFRGLPPV
jgi:glyoxylase-like metal-dependent hydrolase (beta-lactamase superfamily II)